MNKLLQFTGCLMLVLLFSGSAMPPTQSHPRWQTEMLQEVNKLRTRGCRCGARFMPKAPALRLNDRLSRAAQRHAEDMQKRDYFDHLSPEGKSFGDRVSAANYRWATVGENIAWNYREVKAVVDGWRRSPGHCRNLMSRSFTEMGVGMAGPYFVQVLAKPL
ncbi:MAG: CAP domain-containing protein [Bacteroidota bacterium]